MKIRGFTALLRIFYLQLWVATWIRRILRSFELLFFFIRIFFSTGSRLGRRKSQISWKFPGNLRVCGWKSKSNRWWKFDYAQLEMYANPKTPPSLVGADPTFRGLLAVCVVRVENICATRGHRGRPRGTFVFNCFASALSVDKV